MTLIRQSCCCKTCASTIATSCEYCSCCNASKYRVCVTGETGACEVLNNNKHGWVLPEVSAGNYEFSNDEVKLTLELTGDLCETPELVLYYKDGESWVECQTFAPVLENEAKTCNWIKSTGGVTVKVRPVGAFDPETWTATVDGLVSCGEFCTDLGFDEITIENVKFKAAAFPDLDGEYTVPRSSSVCLYEVKIGEIVGTICSDPPCNGTEVGEITLDIILMIHPTSGASIYVTHPVYGHPVTGHITDEVDNTSNCEDGGVTTNNPDCGSSWYSDGTIVFTPNF